VEPVLPDSADGLEVIRHSTAHLMAQAVQELFPGTQVTIGPVIEDGFYYDFVRAEPFTPEDLKKIEKKMKEIVSRNLTVTRHEMAKSEAVQLFAAMGERYKVEILEGIVDERVSVYQQGEWKDLCRGPHVPSTGKLGAFKLTSVAGAYWRGSEKNAMLQRIYGTAWPTMTISSATSSCSRKPGAAIIASSARSSTSSASSRSRREARSSIPRGRSSTTRSSPSSAGSTIATATAR
jgi:threonyl-tRNA synthetase